MTKHPRELSTTQLILNAVHRNLSTMFPGYFGNNVKHNHNRDFGWPDVLTFDEHYYMYRRNGVAAAGVDYTIAKTWEENPTLRETPSVSKVPPPETPREAEVKKAFRRLRVWQKLATADTRSMVGKYAGVILRFADDQDWDQPVKRVAGLDDLVELIPAWEKQLRVQDWDTNPQSLTYGHPKMFQFNEAEVGQLEHTSRHVNIHPDRVIVWSKDGTVHDRSDLESGHNALLDLEKISGAGGEGFWKNAKSSPILNIDPEANLDAMAQAMGVSVNELPDAMDEQVKGWSKGFDNLLMLQGIETKSMPVQLPSPEHFFQTSLSIFCASIKMPVKVLIGQITGERASTEDAKGFNKTIQARREFSVIPNIDTLIERLIEFGVLSDSEWSLQWTSLTEASPGEQIERVVKMSQVNQVTTKTGERTFTIDELREVVGKEPLTEAEKVVEIPQTGDEFGNEPNPGGEELEETDD